jgi:hypothetical protein
VKEKARVYSPYHRTTPTERERWVRQFEASGLSQRDFATRHGMGLSTLGKWLQLEKAVPARLASLPWQEVALAAVPSPAWAAEIAFKDGSTLRLGASAADTLLGRWLACRS